MGVWLLDSLLCAIARINQSPREPLEVTKHKTAVLFACASLFDLSLRSFQLSRDEGLSHGVKAQVALKIVLQVVEQK